MKSALTLEVRVLQRAVELVGSDRALARQLRVPHSELCKWIAGAESPPRSVFLAAIDVLIEKGDTSSIAGAPMFPQAEGPRPWASASPKRVLIVEDNLDSVRSLAILLKDMGHRVEYAINGYAALDVARKLRPEFVFLDLGLPGMDGFTVCRRLKSEPGLESARVIALTAYTQEEYRERARAAGCEMHIIKPASPQYLISLLGSA